MLDPQLQGNRQGLPDTEAGLLPPSSKERNERMASKERRASTLGMDSRLNQATEESRSEASG